MDKFIIVIPLLFAFLLDKLIGDPLWLPHPIVLMGKGISFFEKIYNRGTHKKIKGSIVSLLLILYTFFVTESIVDLSLSMSKYLYIVVCSILIFYCFAAKTLIDEVKMVFEACDVSIDAARKQVARIVGRDTGELSIHEIKCAALETLSENLSDGVIAPLFWYIVGGVPAMMAYKMINTLDSMIGYKTKRYKDFGLFAARVDDIVNYIPARLTALLMILSCGRIDLFKFVLENGKKHVSPNSGYPEAALAGILNCRFGGPHNYFGELIYKPYIGENERQLCKYDLKTAISINRRVEIVMIGIIIFISFL